MFIFSVKKHLLSAICFLPLVYCSSSFSQSANTIEKDNLPGSTGNLEIYFVGHGTLLMHFQDAWIHIDPYSRVADYSQLPKADYIFITHHHGDHLDTSAINKIWKSSTQLFAPDKCTESIPRDWRTKAMNNGDFIDLGFIKAEAVPAYNLVHKRSTGEPYHPKGEGNGYILTFGDKRIYIAGDTENIPEMNQLKNISVAFLPMNLPYTMTPEMVADAALRFHPRILYPYHFGNTDPNLLIRLLENSGIEIRIRKLS